MFGSAIPACDVARSAWLSELGIAAAIEAAAVEHVVAELAHGVARLEVAADPAWLAAAIGAARPGGVIAYVTCSPHRRETTEVVESAEGVEVVDAGSVLPEVPDAARGPYLQLWPHRHGTDAMFLALLRKR